MNHLPLSCTSSPCKLLFFNRAVYGLVQATVGVGTVLIWDFCVAYTREGEGSSSSSVTHPVYSCAPVDSRSQFPRPRGVTETPTTATLAGGGGSKSMHVCSYTRYPHGSGGALVHPRGETADAAKAAKLRARQQRAYEQWQHDIDHQMVDLWWWKWAALGVGVAVVGGSATPWLRQGPIVAPMVTPTTTTESRQQPIARISPLDGPLDDKERYTPRRSTTRLSPVEKLLTGDTHFPSQERVMLGGMNRKSSKFSSEEEWERELVKRGHRFNDWSRFLHTFGPYACELLKNQKSWTATNSCKARIARHGEMRSGLSEEDQQMHAEEEAYQLL